ncbi:MAG: YHS domain-containing protein [Acidobacteriota bacterium]
MRKELKLWAFLLVLSLAFVLSGIAQHTGEETAIDPVCGMTVKKAQAKATFEYKGETYYFCSEGCKNTFMKEPEKYLQKAAEPKGQMMGQRGMCGQKHGQMMAQAQGKEGLMSGPMHGRMAGHSETMDCPLHSEDVEVKVENSADGVAVKITSKNPELVKKIQEHMAAGKGCPAKFTCCQKTKEN